MKLSIISFTEKGKLLSEDIVKKFDEAKINIELFTKHKVCETGNGMQPVQYVDVPLGEWAKTQMCRKNAMLFIGACGIAVRAVAPYLTDKLHDSPVLVMDERGRYVIPVLSGHMGGANRLAVCLAAKTGAEPVITTATDINGRFAVDLFAKTNRFAIINKEGIAKVSSRVLEGEEVSLCVEGVSDADSIECIACIPPEVHMVPYPPEKTVDVLVASGENQYDAVLLLRPKKYVIGLGCKRGKHVDEIEQFITARLDKLGISVTQLFALASISQKQEEQGIIEWCRKADVPFLTYTAEELQEVAGDFQKSDFVMNAVGVDNVCERAALKACGADGRLVARKYAERGMTIAVSERKWKVVFGDE